jgi:hypothetical protein
MNNSYARIRICSMLQLFSRCFGSAGMLARESGEVAMGLPDRVPCAFVFFRTAISSKPPLEYNPQCKACTQY